MGYSAIAAGSSLGLLMPHALDGELAPCNSGPGSCRFGLLCQDDSSLQQWGCSSLCMLMVMPWLWWYDVVELPDIVLSCV